jgi:hypothetical protein
MPLEQPVIKAVLVIWDTCWYDCQQVEQ